ncbi:MAG: DnaJ domain-containing protein [Bifidobacteriaceae bacterium]|jgi:molecular chaperone DnaJ|nr:DnaJ domain-containing protein [Bifidobacteriaceae bacterium]
MAGQDWVEKDFYKTLEVDKSADEATIKKAYRKLARQFHPDANPGNASAEERFKEVSEAYSVLSDPEQRQQYDSIRAMASGGARFAAGPGGNGGGSGFEDLFSAMFPGGSGRIRYSTGGGPGGVPGGGMGINLEDLLAGFSAGGGPGGPGGAFPRFGGAGRGPLPGSDMRANLTLPFRVAAAGSTQALTIDGRSLTVRIPAGVRNGQKIKLAGQGNPSANGGPPGDLIVTVNVPPHPVFSLDGNNLRLTVPVTFAEAALGSRIEVPTLDGTNVTVKVPGGTPSGRTLRVRGKGVRTAAGQGDLLVTMSVAVPQRVSGKVKQALEALREATRDDDPRAELRQQAAT